MKRNSCGHDASMPHMRGPASEQASGNSNPDEVVPQNRPVNDKTRRQLHVIKAVAAALDTAEIRAWLFGGWGLDARIGHITREHGDVESWIERVDSERSKTVLVTAGATALGTQPQTESSSSPGVAPTSAPPTSTDSPMERSASRTGAGPTGCFRPAPSPMSQWCSRDSRSWL